MDKKFYINIKGKKQPVTEEIYKVSRKYSNQLSYAERIKKAEKITIDKHGKISIEPSKEVSLERLLEIDIDFSDTRSPSVEDLIEVKLMLEHALGCLHPKDRALIELHYYKGYSKPEIAKLLGISLVAVHKKIDRILYQLNELLSN